MAEKTVNISFLGDKELERKFKKIPPKLQRKFLMKAAKGVAKDILSVAEPKVPQSPGSFGSHGGAHLKDTLRAVRLKGSKNKIGWQVITGTRIELGLGPDEYYYPAGIELGNTRKREDSYLRYALALNRQNGLNQMARAINQSINDAKNL